MQLDANFKHLGMAPVGDIVTLCKSILTETDWLAWTSRQDKYSSHSSTQSIPLIWPVDDLNLETVGETQWFPKYIDFFKPTLDYFLSDIFTDSNSKIARLVLTRLNSASGIPVHTDGGHSLESVHRCHIAIVTNADCIFTVGGEEKKMTLGNVWEINNTVPHQVDNWGTTPRIHLMIDWVCNV